MTDSAFWGTAFCLAAPGGEEGARAEEWRDLASREETRKFLEAFSRQIRAESAAVAAVYFGSWFAYLPAGLQYALSVRNIAPDLSLGNIGVRLYEIDGRTSIAFAAHSWTESVGPARQSEERTAWVRGRLTDFYGGTARPVFEALAAASGAPIRALWGQLPTLLRYGTEQWRTEEANPEVAASIDEDYEWLPRIDSGVFGVHNPYNVRFKEMAGTGGMFRKTACCLFYRTEDADYCYTCPKLSDRQRLEKYGS